MKQLSIPLLLFFLPITLCAKVIYVKKDALGLNNGITWEHAFQELKTALPMAQSGDEIWVAAGEYRSIIPGDSSFVMKSGVRLLGGFSGWETNENQRDWVANPTILSGKSAFPIAPNVIYCTGTDPNTLIDGFTIRDGYAQPFNSALCEEYADQHICHGGGVYLYSGNPQKPTYLTIQNCRFIGNDAAYGAGIAANFWLGGGGLTVKNCYFKNNAYTAAGMYVEISNGVSDAIVLVDSCTFDENNAYVVGAIQARNNGLESNILFSNCLFRKNKATFNAGTIWGGGFTVRDCVFDENKTVQYAGTGGALSGGGFTVERCVFKNNRAVYGGAISGGNISVSNSVFVNNIAINSGGAVRTSYQGLFVNNLFVNNYAGKEGGVFKFVSYHSDTIINCVFIGNRAGEKGDWSNAPILSNVYMDYCYLDAPSCDSLLVDYSSSFPDTLVCGMHMLFADVDPMFRDTSSGDYSLLPCSPLINWGDNSWVNRFGLVTDLLGYPRIQEETVDLGVFESKYNLSLGGVNTTPTCPGQNTGTASWNLEAACPPFFFSWSGGSGEGGYVDSLGVGDHTFTITDSKGRILETTFSIGQTAMLALTSFVTDATSAISTDGKIQTSINAGLPPYSYLWNTGATTPFIQGLLPGMYSLTVTDGSDCDHFFQYEVQYTSSATELVPETQIVILPNPTTTNATQILSKPPAPKDCIVKIYDFAGRLIVSESIPEGTSEHTLQLDDCSRGMYFVYITAHGRVMAREKLIVLH